MDDYAFDPEQRIAELRDQKRQADEERKEKARAKKESEQ